MGLLVDGVMGWLGYWGQKQQIKRAAYLEEYKKQIAQKIAKIPEENLIEPPVRIVGPAIEASKFFIEETTCREMFAQLIASSCNSVVSGAVHPSSLRLLSNYLHWMPDFYYCLKNSLLFRLLN